MSDFRPHVLDWSPDQIRRFWDFLSTSPGIEHAYFAQMAGKSLINYVRKRIHIGTAVDIGCGRGDLIEVLIKSGLDVYGVDQSPASVEQVQKRFAREPRFKGAARAAGEIDLPDGSVDTGFMIEVVEHLNDQALGKALSEAHRMIRPGGHLVLTTPNEEDLSLNTTMCPECGSIYHPVQHVRSWSAKSLSDHVRLFGFEAVSAAPTVLSACTGLIGLAYSVAYQAVRRRKPHLIYIGRRLPG